MLWIKSQLKKLRVKHLCWQEYIISTFFIIKVLPFPYWCTRLQYTKHPIPFLWSNSGLVTKISSSSIKSSFPESEIQMCITMKKFFVKIYTNIISISKICRLSLYAPHFLDFSLTYIGTFELKVCNNYIQNYFLQKSVANLPLTSMESG